MSRWPHARDSRRVANRFGRLFEGDRNSQPRITRISRMSTLQNQVLARLLSQYEPSNDSHIEAGRVETTDRVSRRRYHCFAL